MENLRIIPSRTHLNSVEEEGTLGVRAGLVRNGGVEVLLSLAGNLVKDGDADRIAAAKTISQYRDPVSVRSLAQAVAPNIDRPAVLHAIVEALQELDLCSSIPVLAGMLELNHWALAREVLQGIEHIGCTEALPELVNLVQRAECETKKPNSLTDPFSGSPTPNPQKNTILAALAGPLHDLLQSLTGLNLSSSWEWALAVAGRRTPIRRHSQYRCDLKNEVFTVPNDKPQTCPFQSGGMLHGDVFLKHVGE
jgi:hypothetical protein